MPVSLLIYIVKLIFKKKYQIIQALGWDQADTTIKKKVKRRKMAVYHYYIIPFLIILSVTTGRVHLVGNIKYCFFFTLFPRFIHSYVQFVVVPTEWLRLVGKPTYLVSLELTTMPLTGICSTSELPDHIVSIFLIDILFYFIRKDKGS